MYKNIKYMFTQLSTILAILLFQFIMFDTTLIIVSIINN
jgi:hypothetical protein